MAARVLRGALAEFLNCVAEPLRTEVASRLIEIRRPKGRTLVEKDSRSADVYFISEGRAEVILYSDNGREVYVHTIEQDDLFGEMAALDRQPRSATVIALTDLRASEMRSEDFIACLQSSAACGIWLARRLVANVRRVTAQVFELRALNVQARIHCELLRLAAQGRPCPEGIEVRPAPTHAELAKRIGTHREAVTREMNALSKSKLIRHDRRALVIMDLAGLRRGASLGAH
jgi:CRP-like cAMP-binding protein